MTHDHARMTRNDYDARLRALLDRYAQQFDEPHLRIWIEPGWLAIAERLFLITNELLSPSEMAGFNWTQIKEKFGRLRTYWGAREFSGPTATLFNGSIEAAHIESARTCQFCGATPAKIRAKTGWQRTLCESCAEEPDRCFIDSEVLPSTNDLDYEDPLPPLPPSSGIWVKDKKTLH